MPKAEFTEEILNQPGLVPNTVVTKCWCGWTTTARDSSLYGPPNVLTLMCMGHRIGHLEEDLEKLNGH